MTIASADWELWSTTARIVVTDGSVLDSAREIADDILGEVEAASSRFIADSEISTIAPRLAEGVDVSPMLALLVRSALEVARETDGDVDPTLGFALEAAGYDRDISLIEDSNSILRAVISPRPGWKSVELNGLHLRLPAHLSFDLGASAKAVAADLVAAAITAQTGSGVLVSLGGDIATAGKAPEEGWNILVQDLPTDPESSVRLSAGFGMATSSTQKRRWERGGVTVHHILDPRTGLPAEPVWRSVTVSAPSCLHANALSTASIIRGEAAIAWLGSMNVAARLVRGNGDVITIGGWPEEKANPDNQEVPSNV